VQGGAPRRQPSQHGAATATAYVTAAAFFFLAAAIATTAAAAATGQPRAHGATVFKRPLHLRINTSGNQPTNQRIGSGPTQRSKG